MVDPEEIADCPTERIAEEVAKLGHCYDNSYTKKDKLLLYKIVYAISHYECFLNAFNHVCKKRIIQQSNSNSRRRRR
jgi:hypothetical protein